MISPGSPILQLFLFDPKNNIVTLPAWAVCENADYTCYSFRQSQFLILDEPTNDLGLPTLQVYWKIFLSEFPRMPDYFR